MVSKFNFKFLGFSLSRLFFYALLILLPIQTRKVFFTDQSFYYGYHAFYNTLFIYLTDIVVLCLIITWIWENCKISHERSPSPLELPQVDRKPFYRIFTRISQDRIYQFLVVFWLILAISVVISHEIWLGIYGLVKITEFILLFAYIRENIGGYPQNNFTPSSSPPYFNLSHERLAFFWLILATLWFQSSLGIYQYINQESAGFKILGEEFLRPGLPGIAEFVSGGIANPWVFRVFPNLSRISPGETINIRAYGTLPHPNVLAGLLFFGLLLNVFLLYKTNLSRERLKTAVLALSLILISTGLTVTFSRLAWVVTFLGIIVWFGLVFGIIRKPERDTMDYGGILKGKISYYPQRLAFIALGLLLALGLNLLLFGNEIRDRLASGNPGQRGITLQESVANRELFNGIALGMIKHNPLLGVGMRNFVVEMDNYAGERLLPYLHQPVHNIYLLIAAEAGIAALAIFLFVLYNIVRRALRTIGDKVFKFTLLSILFGFLAISLSDHYFWTIQQGSLIFWITLGLLTAKPAERLSGGLNAYPVEPSSARD